MSNVHSDRFQDEPDRQDPPEFPDVPLQEPPREVTGRTVWDILAGKGLLILGLLISVLTAAYLIVIRDEIDWSAITDFLVSVAQEYWYVAVGPVVGLIAGDRFALIVHNPDCRVVLTLDVKSNTIQGLIIPERLFRLLNQSGNNVVYHSPLGMPVYLAESVDLQNGVIDYGWVHEHDALVVFTKVQFYEEWKETLDQVMADNLKMMDSPEVYGMRFAGEALKRHLDRLASSVGVKKPSSGGPSDYSGSETSSEKEVGDDDS